jgi:hypothetical protein
MRHLHHVGALALAATLVACATARKTDPPMTATEQLLISTAVDRSAAQLKLALPEGSKVFLDPQYVEFEPSQMIYPRYAVAAVRSQLLHLGAQLTANRSEADVVVELRSGAQSIDDHNTLVGLPGFSLPVPLAGALAVPEVPLFKYFRQTGHAKLGVVAYDREGRLIADSGVQHGEAETVHWVVLFVFSHTSQDLYPE